MNIENHMTVTEAFVKVNCMLAKMLLPSVNDIAFATVSAATPSAKFNDPFVITTDQFTYRVNEDRTVVFAGDFENFVNWLLDNMPGSFEDGTARDPREARAVAFDWIMIELGLQEPYCIVIDENGLPKVVNDGDNPLLFSSADAARSWQDAHRTNMSALGWEVSDWVVPALGGRIVAQSEA